MSRQSIIFIVSYLLVSLAVITAVFVWQQWPFAIATMLIVASWLGLALALILQAGTVVVDEMEVAVIFSRHTNNFAYFIDSKPSGPVQGRPFNLHANNLIHRLLYKTRPYQHFINPFQDKVQDRISKRPQTAKGATEGLRTKEGIPLKIEWSIGYTMDPLLIRPGLEFKLARGLPQFSNGMISGRVIHSLRHIIEQKSVADLYRLDAMKNLEKEVREEVTRRSQGIGVNDIVASDTKIGPILMPKEVEDALKAAHERELQTTTAVKALEQLRLVVSRFAPSDMERLAELERLRILDQHGGAFIYSMSSLMKTVEKNQTQHVHHNGE
jgi:regulator of protease activity HflC (stomatin/prohibitin superfamily)